MSELISDLGTAALVAGAMFVALWLFRLPAMAVAAVRHLSQRRLIPRPAVVLSALVGLMAFAGARGYRECDLGVDTCSWANLGWAVGLPFVVMFYGAAALLVALVMPPNEPTATDSPATPRSPRPPSTR